MGIWQELEKWDLKMDMEGLALFRNRPGASLHGDVMLVSGLGSFEDPARCWGRVLAGACCTQGEL
jgi:hypothetical protein